ncbi:hypothetical protein [Nonomuraea sp. CA-141351]|uniref:hypothetical protein n=1 Tax=Nonomuraea sp. CA-141351 TaxID=3239996 RepID=UPI003D8A17B4
MWWHSIDYLKRDGRQRGMLVHRGFSLHRVPRLMLWCRLRGHRPVVDGYGPHKPGLDAARWVACGRCGVRPDPQGSLDPDGWEVGQSYDGPYAGDEMNDPLMRALLGPGNTVIKGGMHLPGRWPATPTGTLGGELVIGRTFGVFSAEVTIGAAGAEHTLAAHLRVWPFGALYLHTEGFGAWLQRRLIPEGYTSRAINVSVDDWAIRWQLWAREGEWSRNDPWWMHGRISLDLVQALFGPKRYSYETVDGPMLGWVTMPEGDSHQMQLKLERVRLGRPRLNRAAKYHWSVEWTADSPGIETRPGKGGIISASVRVPDEAVEARCWDVLACALIARKLGEDRTRYGYRPENMEG